MLPLPPPLLLLVLLSLLLSPSSAATSTISSPKDLPPLLPSPPSPPLLVLILPPPSSSPSLLPAATAALKTVHEYGDVTTALASSSSPADLLNLLSQLGADHPDLDLSSPIAFLVMPGPAPASLPTTTSSIHFQVPTTKQHVQRLLLPPDILLSDPEDASNILDALTIPALLPPLNTISDENKHGIFRKEFSSFFLLFPATNVSVPTATTEALSTTAASFYELGTTTSPRFVVVPPADYPRYHPFSQFYIGSEMGDASLPLAVLTVTKTSGVGTVRCEPLPL